MEAPHRFTKEGSNAMDRKQAEAALKAAVWQLVATAGHNEVSKKLDELKKEVDNALWAGR